MKVPFLPQAQIEARAAELLDAAFGLGRPRCPTDLEALIYDYLSERFDLSFDDEGDLGSSDGDLVMGAMLPVQNKILVTRSLKQQPARYRFTVAHEIGHWLLHRQLLLPRADELSLFDARAPEPVFACLQRCVFPAAGRPALPPEEWQANCFAAALLIDRHALREEFAKRFGAVPAARDTPMWRGRSTSIREHARLIAAADMAGSPPLHAAFGVSIEAMAIALESAGYAVEHAGLL